MTTIDPRGNLCQNFFMTLQKWLIVAEVAMVKQER